MNSAGQNNTDTFLFDLFKRLEKYSLTYVYKGVFNPSLTDKILALAETNLNLLGEVVKTQKKVYFVMVESLQNITRHQDVDQERNNQAFFVVQNKDGKYGMASGNVIENENIPSLKEKLDKINSLDAEALKAHYKDVLENTGLSDKGGAGLGLIEIARRSGGKLAYEFKTLSNSSSFFYFKSRIAGDQSGEDLSGLEGTKLLHQFTNEHNIAMVYQGFFTHDNLKSLLTMTEGSVGRSEVSFKRKAVNIMVELLQNICHHGGSPYENKQGTPGILVVSTNPEYCSIMSGNYISNSNAKALADKLNKVNSCTEEELEDLYNETILKEHEPGQKGAGLGFIDMRIKSGKKIDYTIIDFNANFSFLSVSVSIAY